MIDYQSKLFAKTIKEFPKDEEAINAKLLIRAGFIAKQMAGVFTLLPFGLKVVNKINKIIREELDAVGCQELFMPAFQSKDLWEKTGRWDTDNQVMYQMKDRSGKEIGLGYTHEEVITEMATKYIQSYKDLPKAVYQIQTKFRDEPRAKSGMLRGKEFLMKDLYSFHANKKDRDEYYEKIKEVYKKIFKRIGIEVLVTSASGGTFSKYSHEFQTISESGEDTIFVCNQCQSAINNEIIDEYGKKCKDCNLKLNQKNAIEVGNIFKLGTKFSEALGLCVADATGNIKPVEMASYGIGPTRVMGTIVEVNHDDKGIIWTKETAPYDCHLIQTRNSKSEIRNKFKSQNIQSKTENIIELLEKAGLDVLVDEREGVSIGEKLADADLIGIPYQIILGEKTDEGEIEIKDRKSVQSKIVKIEKIVDVFCPQIY